MINRCLSGRKAVFRNGPTVSSNMQSYKRVVTDMEVDAKVNNGQHFMDVLVTNAKSYVLVLFSFVKDYSQIFLEKIKTMAPSHWQQKYVVEGTEQKSVSGWNDALQKGVDKLEAVFDSTLGKKTLSVSITMADMTINLVNKIISGDKTSHCHEEPVETPTMKLLLKKYWTLSGMAFTITGATVSSLSTTVRTRLPDRYNATLDQVAGSLRSLGKQAYSSWLGSTNLKNPKSNKEL